MKNSKYWQYRDNFNKHFILIDRDSSGCIGDGIGLQSSNLCEFTKTGYGLPATSINVERSGGFGMKDRNDTLHYPMWLYNQDCADEVSDPNNPTKHNYLDVGSETPHQMGWYWATLATEYELLKRNGQLDEAQRTLEELFLGLQAYRRLDMQANCMAKKRYDEITDEFEVENCTVSVGIPNSITVSGTCLCGEKYWGQDETHASFGVPCVGNCSWQPDLSGYSGFFLREDATQALEALHDPSDDTYNIDMVSSDFAMSMSPPCVNDFSQPCYLAHRQAYMSQDGIVGLMIGLALIKRYIPENAEVTMCDGTKDKPLEMAKKITSAIVDRLDDTHYNRIFFPGSDECCARRAVFSNAEGGRAMAIIHGLKKAADYIDDHDRHSNLDEVFSWSLLRKVVEVSQSVEGKFWLRLKALGWDIGDERNATKTLFHSAVETQNQEILILINNLLYPGGENLSTNQAFFAELLCSAPCGGPCKRQEPYQGESSTNWPIFNCSNHPDWSGQRWETRSETSNRQFNGLDFMALYNIYMLHYNQSPEVYFNPDRPEGWVSLYADKIEGPSVLCKDQTAYYEAQPIYGVVTANGPSTWFEHIQWTSSSNFNISTPNTNGTDIEAVADANPSYIEATVQESRDIPVYWTDGTPHYTLDETSPFYPQHRTSEYCTLTLRKTITTTTDNYSYESSVDHCLKEYEFRAIGLATPGIEFHWKIELLGTSTVYNYTGSYIFLSGTNIFPVQNGAIRVTLTVIAGDCSESEEPYIEALNCYGGGMGLRVNPNPAQNQVAIEITPGEGSSAYNITDPNGVRIRIVPQSGGTLVADTRIYSNGESIGVTSLQNGVYLIEASEADLTVPITTTLVIAR